MARSSEQTNNADFTLRGAVKMAQVQEARSVEKRRPGRPPKNSSTPVNKKQKTAHTPTPTSTPIQGAAPSSPPPSAISPAPVEKKVIRLPSKTSDNRPLPTVPEVQSLSLSNDEYQSLAGSAVLAIALDRSRARWTSHGVFQKYWVKPESGKNAKPPPKDNPEAKWMKSKGECRIRLEPHVFTADVYVEERPKPPPPKHSPAYGQPYKSHPVHPFSQQPTLNRPFNLGAPLPGPSQQHQQPRVPAPTTPLQTQDKKASPDPVISMLASRASSNPELKGLMKEVATSNATPEQLRVFQKHIDELTEIIKKQKKDEEEQAAKVVQQNAGGGTNPTSAHALPATAPEPAQPQTLPQHRPFQTPQRPSPLLYQPQQPAWTAPVTTHLPLILAFRDHGSSEDRFLFPQMSILEPLSPQHELVSFMVCKKGREAVDAAGLEPDKEYWQPVTMMVEVAYGREEILRCIRKWVKPADEVRKHMENIMQQCQRAPTTHLAFRLPFKGSAHAESDEASKEATPALEERGKTKSGVKYIKKLATSGNSGTPPTSTAKKAGDASGVDGPNPPEIPAVATPTPAPAGSKDVVPPDGNDAAAESGAAENKPRRTLRKSVRIEG